MSDNNEPPRKGQMVFINKSQSSKHLSRSEGDERSRIFSQAQSSQAQQKVQKQISYESDAASGSSSESRERVLRRQGSGNVSKRSKTLMLRPRRAMIAQQRKRQSSSPSSAQAGDQSTIPFSEDFRMLSAPRESMADYYMNVLIMFYHDPKLPSIFLSRDMLQVSRVQTFALAKQSPLLLNSLLCAASTAIHLQTANPNHRICAAHFKSQAIKKIRHSLAQEQAAGALATIVYCISLLLWVECLEGNLQDVEVHVAGLEKLIARTEVTENWSLHIWQSVFSCANMCAAMLRSKPKLTPIPQAQHPLSRNAINVMAAQSEHPIKLTGKGFTASFEVHHIIGPRLLHHINRHCNYTTFHRLSAAGYLTPTDDDLRLIYMKRMSVEHQLLTLPFETGLGPFQNAIRLAVFTSSQPIILIAKVPCAFTRSMATQIRGFMEYSDRDRFLLQEPKLYLWVTFIGAMVSLRDWENLNFFGLEFERAARVLKLTYFKQVERILERFLYNPLHLRSRLYYLWNKILKYRSSDHYLASWQAESPGAWLDQEVPFNEPDPIPCYNPSRTPTHGAMQRDQPLYVIE